MKTKIWIISCICMIGYPAFCQHIQSWGDQNNGTYINPVLNADYSDPDVIRVDNKYYMVCSEFHYMGMTVQESDDMVNWRIAGRIYDKMDFPPYHEMKAYGSGSWAPALRYHDHKFWLYFCTPNEGLFMTTATDAKGPWEPLKNVVHVAGWEDPCPFWDEDGNAYLSRSKVGAGPIIIHKMSADGKSLLDEGVTIYTGPVAEGTKIHKRNGFYYLSIPEGGVAKGWQTILRSKNIYGPYEKRVVLETGSTEVNGPHQGSLLDTPNGSWWFIHFQLAGALGRVMHLQPMHWQDDWPVIGVDIDRNGIGEPVKVWEKPDVGVVFPVSVPQSSDEFDRLELGLQWQWNHNPVNNQWSLTQKKGWLCLNALKAPNLKQARNTLTQKVMGDRSEAVIEMDASGMISGQKAGLASLSNIFNSVGVVSKEGKLYLYFDENGALVEEIPLSKSTIYLKVNIHISEKEAVFSYSLNNKTFNPIGHPFRVKWGDWKATRIGLFSYNENGDGGVAAFNYLRYTFDGPPVLVK